MTGSPLLSETVEAVYSRHGFTNKYRNIFFAKASFAQSGIKPHLREFEFDRGKSTPADRVSLAETLTRYLMMCLN
jgi:hypothetical protein